MDIHVQATTYTVCALPLDHPSAYHLAIAVESASNGTWVMRHGPYYLCGDGDWSPNRSDAQRMEDLDTALRAARDWAPRVDVNGFTAATVLARGR